MPTDHSADPWSGTTYNGFAGAGTPSGPPERVRAAPARRPSTRTLLISGVAAAAVLGIVLGVLARPRLDTGQATLGQPMRPAATAPAQAAAPDVGQVQIQVNPPPAPAPAPQSAGRLEVLPPDLVRAARQSAGYGPDQPAQPAAPVPTMAEPPAAAHVAVVTPPPAVRYTPPPVAVAPPTPAPETAPQLRASFDCAAARAGAEEMVCSDPQLAAADRQLARAYRRALDSGVPPAELRADQRDWLSIREDAARHSPRAVASIYDQRIDELDRMADDASR
ncbi:lysozyme inhibitor LprI family protein [Phenylobacterium hankyongense]|nr:lysozyme inhibitor LprI family protein [Phenylobacterium hankyongense]